MKFASFESGHINMLDVVTKNNHVPLYGNH